MLFCGSEYSANCQIKCFVVTLWCVPSFDKEVPNFFFFFSSSHRKSLSQSTSAAVHTFCERQKPIPDGAGQYYVAGVYTDKLSGIKFF